MVSGQQGSYPGYQQPYQPVHKPLSEYLKPLVSDLVLAALLWIGLLLMCIGAIVGGVSDTSGAIEFGWALKSFGLLFVTWGLIIGGMLRHDMEKWARFAMIFAGSALVAVVGFWPIEFAF